MSLSDLLEQVEPLDITGRVAQAVGLVIEGTGARSTVGDICHITREDGKGVIPAEVVGFRGDRVLLMPLGEMQGIGPSSRIAMTGQAAGLAVGPALLGRVLNGLGEPLDGKGPLTAQGIGEVVEGAFRRAGLSGPRSSPHTFGRNWIAEGGDENTLQKIFGHKTRSTVKIYTNLNLKETIRQHSRFSPLRRQASLAQAPLWDEVESILGRAK